MVVCLFSLSFHERVPGSFPAFIIELKQILLLKIKLCKKSAKPTWHPRSNNEENYFEDFTGISDKKKKTRNNAFTRLPQSIFDSTKIYSTRSNIFRTKFSNENLNLHLNPFFILYLHIWICDLCTCNLKKVQYYLPIISLSHLRKKH